MDDLIPLLKKGLEVRPKNIATFAGDGEQLVELLRHLAILIPVGQLLQGIFKRGLDESHSIVTLALPRARHREVPGLLAAAVQFDALVKKAVSTRPDLVLFPDVLRLRGKGVRVMPSKFLLEVTFIRKWLAWVAEDRNVR